MSQQKPTQTESTPSQLIANGLFWAHRVISASLEMAVFLVIGYFLDRYFSTRPWLMLIFAVIGMVAMFQSLLKIAAEFQKNDGKKPSE